MLLDDSELFLEPFKLVVDLFGGLVVTLNLIVEVVGAIVLVLSTGLNLITKEAKGTGGFINLGLVIICTKCRQKKV